MTLKLFMIQDEEYISIAVDDNEEHITRVCVRERQRERERRERKSAGGGVGEEKEKWYY